MRRRLRWRQRVSCPQVLQHQCSLNAAKISTGATLASLSAGVAIAQVAEDAAVGCPHEQKAKDALQAANEKYISLFLPHHRSKEEAKNEVEVLETKGEWPSGSSTSMQPVAAVMPVIEISSEEEGEDDDATEVSSNDDTEAQVPDAPLHHAEMREARRSSGKVPRS